MGRLSNSNRASQSYFRHILRERKTLQTTHSAHRGDFLTYDIPLCAQNHLYVGTTLKMLNHAVHCSLLCLVALLQIAISLIVLAGEQDCFK